MVNKSLSFKVWWQAATILTAANYDATLILTLEMMTIKLISLYDTIKAKFHYVILLAVRSEAGRRPAASWNLACHALSSSLAGLRQVCDQPRTCLRPG